MGHPRKRALNGRVRLTDPCIALPLPPVGIQRPSTAYLIPEAITLVDPGPAGDACHQSLVKQLADHGFSIADVRFVVCTHAHAGHAGQAASIQAASGAVIVGHAGTVAAMSSADREATRRLLRRTAEAAAVPAHVVDAAVDEVADDPLVAGPVRAVAEGERVVLGRTWVVSHIPGHSADHIGLLEPRSGAFLGGDLLERHGEVHLPVWDRQTAEGLRVEMLVSSWRKIARLPIEVIWPGHGPPIRAHRVLIARRVASLREQVRTVRASIPPAGATVWDTVMATYGREPTPDELSRALGSTIALLEWLTFKRTVERRLEHGRPVFRPAR